MPVERPEPPTYEKQDEQTLERTLLDMVQRCERNFRHEKIHHQTNHLTNAEAFALATTATLAYKHLRGVYNSAPDSPPIHLSVAPYIDQRYRDAVAKSRDEERRRIRDEHEKFTFGLIAVVGISLLVNLTLIAALTS